VSQVRKYLAKIGGKGGRVTGPSKVRGGPEYYRAIAAKAAKSSPLCDCCGQPTAQGTRRRRCRNDACGKMYCDGCIGEPGICTDCYLEDHWVRQAHSSSHSK
jgi:hypothetical protein